MNFDQLRVANLARLKYYEGCDKWTPADWMVALVGDVGEAANIMKKIRRGDFKTGQARDEALAALGSELADVQTYLCLLANQFDVDLGEATRAKWNLVSGRVNCPMEIDEAGALVVIDRKRKLLPGMRLADHEIEEGMILRFEAGNTNATSLAQIIKRNDDGTWKATACCGGTCWVSADENEHGLRAPFRSDIQIWNSRKRLREGASSMNG